MVGIIMKKELIKQRFSKSLNTYQQSAVVQMQMAKNLVDLLPAKDYENILELGCGTGFLTKTLIQRVRYKTYTAIDIVKECEPYIKNIDENIVFVNNDIESITLEGKYDLIVSNAAFQWLDNFEAFIKHIKNHLSDEGILLFTTFGQKNFQEIANTANISLNYYSIEELKTILNNYNLLHIQEETIVQDFKSIKEMFEHMKKTGVNSVSESTWGLKETKQFKQRYQDIYKDSIHLTYNPIYVLLKH